MDLRKRRSQKKLQDALAWHLQYKTLDQITIGELTKTAGVSRQTFYANFANKQSILLGRIEGAIESTNDYFLTIEHKEGMLHSDIIALTMMHFLRQCNTQKSLMCAAFSGHAGAYSLLMLKRYLSNIIAQRILLQFDHNFTEPELDVISDFYGGAYLGVIQGWLMGESGDKKIEEIANYVSLLVPYGLDGLCTLNKPSAA